MTIPGPGSHLGDRGLIRLAESFAGQEDVGLGGGLAIRLARYLMGDPALALNVTVPFNTPTPLPDNTPAHTAVFIVVAAPIKFRLDGSPPQASDAVLPIGTIVTLTGQPTIKAWQASSQSLTSATLAGAYFT